MVKQDNLEDNQISKPSFIEMMGLASNFMSSQRLKHKLDDTEDIIENMEYKRSRTFEDFCTTTGTGLKYHR